MDDSLPLLVLTITSFQIDEVISQVPLSASSQETLLGSMLGTTSGKSLPISAGIVPGKHESWRMSMSRAWRTTHIFDLHDLSLSDHALPGTWKEQGELVSGVSVPYTATLIRFGVQVLVPIACGRSCLWHQLCKSTWLGLT